MLPKGLSDNLGKILQRTVEKMAFLNKNRSDVSKLNEAMKRELNGARLVRRTRNNKKIYLNDNFLYENIKNFEVKSLSYFNFVCRKERK